jgi:hypothetical protein
MKLLLLEVRAPFDRILTALPLVLEIFREVKNVSSS